MSRFTPAREVADLSAAGEVSRDERAREDQAKLGRCAKPGPTRDMRIDTAISYAKMMHDVGGWSAEQAKDYVNNLTREHSLRSG